MSMPKLHPYDNWTKEGEFIKPGSQHLTKCGKKEIVRLLKSGKGPLSIAVRLGLPYRKVKEHLKKIGHLETEDYIIKGLNEQWIGT